MSYGDTASGTLAAGALTGTVIGPTRKVDVSIGAVPATRSVVLQRLWGTDWRTIATYSAATEAVVEVGAAPVLVRVLGVGITDAETCAYAVRAASAPA
jgi:hypothetical protein